MNRAGFTTVEVMIASVLIIALVTAGTAGLRQLNLLSQVATTRTAHTEIRSRALSALSNTGACAANIGNVTFVPPVLPNSTIPAITVNELKDGPTTLLKNNEPIQGADRDFDGLRYQIALTFPMTSQHFDLLPTGTGRTVQTRRYMAMLSITGQRESLARQGGRQGALFAEIPITVEFNDVTNQLVSCTTQPEDVEELIRAPLLGGLQHSVQDCLQADGYPMPTSVGLICRIPVPYQPQIAPNYPTGVGPGNNGVPNCATLTAGLAKPWQNAVPLPGLNFNTTVPIDVVGQTCPGDPNKVVTGWHAFSPTGVEFVNFTIKRGTKNTLQVILGGAAFVGLVVVAAIPVIGTIIAAAVVLIGFIVSLFRKCKKETVRVYSQVTAVGCI